MKKLIPILIIGSIFSQDNNKLGFGFTFDAGNPIMNLVSSITSQNVSTALTPTLYLSFGKVEPSISYFSSSQSSSESNSMTILGIGWIENIMKYEKYNTYWGGRFSIAMFSESDDDIYLFSPIYGAEYHFSGNFSLGGETRINYAFINSDEKNSALNISTHLFFRFYN